MRKTVVLTALLSGCLGAGAWFSPTNQPTNLNGSASSRTFPGGRLPGRSATGNA